MVRLHYVGAYGDVTASDATNVRLAAAVIEHEARVIWHQWLFVNYFSTML